MNKKTKRAAKKPESPTKPADPTEDPISAESSVKEASPSEGVETSQDEKGEHGAHHVSELEAKQTVDEKTLGEESTVAKATAGGEGVETNRGGEDDKGGEGKQDAMAADEDNFSVAAHQFGFEPKQVRLMTEEELSDISLLVDTQKAVDDMVGRLCQRSWVDAKWLYSGQMSIDTGLLQLARALKN